MTAGGTSNVYTAYTVTDLDSGEDNGYLMYLSTAQVPDGEFQVRVFTEDADGGITMVLDTELNVDTANGEW